MLYCNHSKGKEQRSQEEGCTVRLNAKYNNKNNLGCDLRKKGVIAMMTLTINRRNHTIEMPTKKYATAASKYGTVEYNEVQAARRDYPNYNVVTRKAPIKSFLFIYKRLTPKGESLLLIMINTTRTNLISSEKFI